MRERYPNYSLPKKNFGGSNFGAQPAPTQDPTFKMWFAKNARRPDVMQNSGNLGALTQLFFKDTNLNQLPVFSNELDDFGGLDKSKRSMDLSEKIIGGMGNTWDKDFQQSIDEGYQIREEQTEPKDKIPFFDNRKYGGMPKAESGIHINYPNL